MAQSAESSDNVDIHIRPLDPGKDMPAVLELIELGFRKELDPQGWKMLRQMRRIYQPSHLTGAVYGRSIGTAGFVSTENERIVGNLSLRHAQPRSTRGYLIGNVVVHPDYRGQGIGRALMERAIDTARAERARWIGLEVRVDNVAATHLYQQLGFHAVGVTHHLLRPKSMPWPAYRRPGRNWRRSKSKDSMRWKQLATLIHSYNQRLVLEIRTGLYEFGGFSRWLNLRLTHQQEQAWIFENGQGNVILSAHVETDRRHRFHVWDVLMHPDAGEKGAQELVAQCLAGTRRFPPWPVVALVPDQPSLRGTLQDVGFEMHRTLQQMILEL
ncbi:MAG: GNAT family N-acetyltransferase [Anaerolineae bacterium]